MVKQPNDIKEKLFCGFNFDDQKGKAEGLGYGDDCELSKLCQTRSLHLPFATHFQQLRSGKITIRSISHLCCVS